MFKENLFCENLLNYSDKIYRLDDRNKDCPYLKDYNLINGELIPYFIKNHKICIGYNLICIRLEHQICHMVEMQDLQRCLLPNWGFTSPLSKTIYSEDPKRKDKLIRKEQLIVSKEHLYRALARETRVRSIEKLISNSSYLLLNNPIWIDMVKCSLPFGKFTSTSDVGDWLDSITESTSKIWNLDRIEFEWKTRIDYISNHLESKNYGI